MNNSKKLHGPASKFAGLFASTALSALLAVVGSSTTANAAACLEEAFGGSVNCTANDIAVASISVTEVLESCDATPGDTFTFNGILNVQPTAQERYDIGFYIGADPKSSTNDDCFVGVIDPAITDVDGDQCGDTSGGGLVNVPVFNVTAPCSDGDDDGFFDVNTCSSWDQNAGTVCTGPADAVPGTSSKCNCEIVPTDIPVPHCENDATLCEDDNECTTDVCNSKASGLGDAFGCSNTNNSNPCDDGLFCNGADNCSGGSCSAHAGDPCAGGGVCGNDCNEDTDSCLVEAGTLCRASAGICDEEEFCTGSDEDCPADAFDSGTVCRASAGVCDVAESCSGSSAACPADDVADAGTTCRGSAGICDVAETCDGSNTDCPADGFQSGATTCRGSAGICDVAENCTGSSAACPADGFVDAGTLCRADAGECDVAENCTGASATCPADSFEPQGTSCSFDENPCTDDQCDGSGTCTAGANSETCDDGLFCNGADTCVDGACTGHAGDPCAGGGVCGDSCNEETDSCFDPAGTVCRAAGGVCDVQEVCTGSSGDCPANDFVDAGTSCRASAGVCDVAESCTGSSATCPADGFVSNATTCRASAGVCDLAENCTGTSASCPNNAFVAGGTVCRADAGDCDVAETCSGSTASCPANGFEPSGTACTSDGNVCTDDRCNASGTCQHPNNTDPCNDGLFCTVNDTCAGGQCGGSPRNCNDGIACSDETCNEATDSCVSTPVNERCDDEDQCTIDTCVVGVGCRNVFSCKDICRRFGFYGKRSGDERGDENIVQEILDATGGLEVCGQTITETSINDSVEGLGLDSALEGLCVRVQRVEERSLYRELVTTALNCAMSGSSSEDFCDSVVTRFVNVEFSECNEACAEGAADSPLGEACIQQLDCYNSGGRMVGNKCSFGTCDVTNELCGGDYGPCPPIASIPFPILQVCERYPDNCRDEEFCQEGLEICPERVPVSSSRACKDAKRNDCTIDNCFIDD